MTNFPKWQDVRDDIVAGAGGEQAVAGARHRNQAYIDGHRQYKHPEKQGRVTIPGKLSKELPPGTERSILRQAGLTWRAQ